MKVWQQTFKKTSWMGWFIAAAILLFACGTITSTAGTTPTPPQPEVIVVTQIVEVTTVPQIVEVTAVPPTSGDASDDAPTPADQPELDVQVITTTPGFNPTRPPVPTVTPGPTQPPLLPGQSEFSPEDIDLLFEVWQLVEETYDGPLPTDQELTDAIIAAALATLDDQFTLYMNATTAERSREAFEGAYEGIGAFVEQNEEGYFVIVRPIAGQPAALAGILPW
ncbi:MAG: hypothetical protein IPL78_33005 [Chloroflexi bacterium]|nr:hypothetical protein [Chloroflexota bacterium]